MKKLSIIFFSICILIGGDSCKSETEFVKNLEIINRLPLYDSIADKNSLIKANEVNREVLIINSKEEMETILSSDFKEKYPEYLKVDFLNYTVLLKTSFLDYEIIERKYYFRAKDEAISSYELVVNYKTDSILQEDSIHIERIALVVDKIPSKSIVSIITGIGK